MKEDGETLRTKECLHLSPPITSDGNKIISMDIDEEDAELTTIEIDTNWLELDEDEEMDNNNINKDNGSRPLSPFTSSPTRPQGPSPIVENGLTATTVSSFKLICVSDLDLPFASFLSSSSASFCSSFSRHKRKSFILYRTIFFLYWAAFVASMEYLLYLDRSYAGTLSLALIEEPISSSTTTTAINSPGSTSANTPNSIAAYRFTPAYWNCYLVLIYSLLAWIVSMRANCTCMNKVTGLSHNLATVFSILLTTCYWFDVAIGRQENSIVNINTSLTFILVNMFGINAFLMITELTICKYPIPKNRMWISMLLTAFYILSILIYEGLFEGALYYENISLEKPLVSFAVSVCLVFFLIPGIHFICERYELFFYGLYVRAEYERARNFTFDNTIRRSVDPRQKRKYLSSRRLSIEALLADLDDLSLEEEVQDQQQDVDVDIIREEDKEEIEEIQGQRREIMENMKEVELSTQI